MQQPLELRFGRPSNDNAAHVQQRCVFDVANEMIEGLSFAAQWRLQGFSEGLHRLDRECHGIGVEDIVGVVQAWEGYDDGAWDGGFVVGLRDGRRARIACLAVAYDWEREARISVRIESPDYDERRANSYWSIDTNSYEHELPELQEYLRRLASIH